MQDNSENTNMEEIISIEKKIRDYFIKMNSKTLRKVKKGEPKREVGIPKHLRDFYQEEIAKLEKQRLFLLKQKKIIVEVNWEDVLFDDFFITFRINNSYTEPFSYAHSRKSLEFLKPYILKRKLHPVIVTLLGYKIISINNLEELDQIFEILSYQGEIKNYLNDFTSSSIEKVFSKIKHVSNSTLLNFYRLNEKGQYLGYLCTLQSEEYKIIPVTEIFSKDDSIIQEDTFLFTIKVEDSIYIIWESTSLSRATYLFKTTELRYQ